MKRIYISGEIGFAARPADFRAALAEAKGGEINIHIASPGGYVYEGLEFFNMIRDYKRDHPRSKIMITLKGLCASMASYIACCPAADFVVAEDNAVFMIHNAWMAALGNATDLEKSAETLRGLDTLISKAYAKITGKSVEEILALMDAETWYFGKEIKDAGFVDEIIDAEDGSKDKAVALAAGKTAFASVIKRMQTANAKAREDKDRAAAIMIGGVESSTTPIMDMGQLQGLTLDELKALNPGLYSRFMNLARKEAAEALLGEMERPQDGTSRWEDPEPVAARAAREEDPPKPTKTGSQCRQTGENIIPEWE